MFACANVSRRDYFNSLEPLQFSVKLFFDVSRIIGEVNGAIVRVMLVIARIEAE